MKNTNKIKRSLGENIFDGVNYLILFLLMAVTVYPLLHVLFASLSNPTSYALHTGLLFWPKDFSLVAYEAVADNPMIFRGYANTILIVVSGTVINIIMTSLGAYVLSRPNLPYKRLMNLFIMFTMFFSGGLIPSYLVNSSLGFIDSYWALLLPGAISTYNMIVMRTSFESIPISLEESALIDGANELRVLISIILPLSMPVIAVMILFYGVAHWNSWFGAMIYLRTREMYPLQLILREILVENDLNNMTTNVGSLDKEPIGETIKFATIVVATVPILLVYPFLQKYFTKGVMIGAVKG